MQDSSDNIRRLTACLRTTAMAALVAMAASASLALPAQAEDANAPSNELWNGLKTDVFSNRTIKENTGLVSIEAPKRAQDAALVPIDIRIDPAKAPAGIKSLTLIIDVNPSPVAATFQFGDNSGVTHLSTRVRVNDYSFVRAIAEMPNGELHMADTFVKASGGCSAPAVKNPDEAAATMGQMKLRQFAAKDSAVGKEPELQLMIRHPNNSGLQRDPRTQYFIPPLFIHQLSVMQGDRKIFSMESGISISEDPNFRFDYRPDGKSPIRAQAVDTKGNKFQDQWPLETAGL